MGVTSRGTALDRLHSVSGLGWTALCTLHRRHVLLHVSGDGLEFRGGAELEVLGGGLGARDVGVREVEGVPGLVDLFAIAEVEDELALEDVAPVWTVAAVVRQAAQERRRVDVLADRYELDGGSLDVLVAVPDNPLGGGLGEAGSWVPRRASAPF